MNNILKVINWDKLSFIEQNRILIRPAALRSDEIIESVKTIIADVRKSGEKALKKYSQTFDHIRIDDFEISRDRICKSQLNINEKTKNAILVAIKNIKRFHSAQQVKEIAINVLPGVHCQQLIKPIESVGLYVPGGSAPLVSTVLMLAIPANIAGCPNIILCSPPPITDEILYAAEICGVNRIFEIGGAQAIAALAFGTHSIPKVNKIFGPGNEYVTEAKRQVSQLLDNLAIDMLAGPSEVLIIADFEADATFIASDLLAQAEHGPNSQVILLTPSVKLVNQVLKELKKQIIKLPRLETIKQSFSKSYIIIANNLLECINISNLYAPEHLIMHTINSQDLLHNIINAGSIFLGQWSPETIGDYASGLNHVLPTYGCATVYSGLNLIDFQKRINVQTLTKEGFVNLAPTVLTLSKIEKMEAHNNSIKLRLNFIKGII
ncbi:histidinol dehydrogenase [Buchnera aphidicola]|uniref:histidinol dehydrogenase n=1 Tax=Buchnera aphidicola TaxID=9 RepID=UPI003463E6A5